MKMHICINHTLFKYFNSYITEIWYCSFHHSNDNMLKHKYSPKTLVTLQLKHLQNNISYHACNIKANSHILLLRLIAISFELCHFQNMKVNTHISPLLWIAISTSYFEPLMEIILNCVHSYRNFNHKFIHREFDILSICCLFFNKLQNNVLNKTQVNYENNK